MEPYNKDRSCECCKDLGESPEPGSEMSPGRRKMLGVIVGIINVGIVGAVVGPVAGFVGAPIKHKSKKGWVRIASVAEIPDGRATEVRYTMRIADGYHVVDRQYSVYVRRDGDEFSCIDPACTHLGCRVDYQQDRDRFLCPCHGGVFDKDGLVVSGPPPRALIKHQVKVEDGEVLLHREV